MKYRQRQYICPMCKTESFHGTNHEGEIYTPCKNCGNGVLYCNEESARMNRNIEHHEGDSIHGVDLTYYQFNIYDPTQREVYNSMRNILRERGYKLFDSINQQKSEYWREVSQISWVSVYRPETFKGQFITNYGRLHAWHEQIYPNKDIKQGYFLEIKGNMKNE